MSISEKDAVLREREAFTTGVYAVLGSNTVEQEATRRYPLPKVTRPRVVQDPVNPRREWRCVGGKMQTREDTLAWYDVTEVRISAPHVALWADLLANPTEEVDE